MSAYRPHGMLNFGEALGRAMQHWDPEAFNRLRHEDKEFLQAKRQMQGFHLGLLAGQAASKDTYARLRVLLSDGSLPSRLRVLSDIVPLQPSAWHGRGADRLHEVLASRVRFSCQDSVGDVVIAADDLEAVLKGQPAPRRRDVSETEQPAPQHTSSPTNKRRSGRPTKPGLDDFWIEAARCVYSGEQGSYAGKWVTTVV